MKLSIYVPLATFLAFFAAAEPTEAPDSLSPSQCLNQCLTEAAIVSGCISQYDSDCTCPSNAFRNALSTCLNDACTEADIADAKQLHVERCGTEPA
ncbi:hypothetical protein N7478_002860 [Penicillium angulare]|uniref:uncharacterized protein n=1 Tax=Penicillium angulare TaxID=116970 RepID=UPI00253FF982|nr:uncharacterized protein N7478_002860 [Penicillium angulare]KAJ5287174.1 hypothetical protein N7478_002860 [Penicillium angulare]